MALNTFDLHSLLGLPKTATDDEVATAFREAAKANHPDHGGSTEAMAALNAARDAYNADGERSSAESESDHGDHDGDIDMADSQSDDDYVEGDGSVSDGESASGSDAEVSTGSDNDDECVFNCNYDVEETGGRYAVLLEEEDRVVTIEEHAEICGCDLDALDSTHFRTVVQGGGGGDGGDSDLVEVEVDGDEDMKDEEVADDDSTFGEGDED